jgi:hypothetical protein
MYTLFLLLCLLPFGNPQADPHPRFAPQASISLPKYPVLPARAFINADFDIEMRIDEGTAKELKVKSSRVITRQGQVTRAFDAAFISSIEDAVRSWRFDPQKEPCVRRMNVSFRSIESTSEEAKPGYYVFRMDGADESLWETPPIQIVIEYHHPLMLMD